MFENTAHLQWFQISKSRDSLYETPIKLAKAMVEITSVLLKEKKHEVVNVIDPTAGGGRLLSPFKKAGYNVLGIEYNEGTYKRLKHNISKDNSRCGHLMYYSHNIEMYSEFDVVVTNPPFGLQWEHNEDKVFKTGKDNSIESQSATIEIGTNFLKEEGLMFAILPTSTWSNQKDKKMVNFIHSEYNILVKITIPDAFKSEYGISKETDFLVMQKKVAYNSYRYDNASTLVFKCELKKFDIDYVLAFLLRHDVSLNSYASRITDFNGIPNYSNIKSYIENVNGLHLTTKGIKGSNMLLSLLNFYDEVKLTDYNSVMGKPTGIMEAYFSLPVLIRSGISRTESFCDEWGVEFKINEKEKEKFKKLREFWKIEALPLYQPKSHEMLAYYLNRDYEAKQDMVGDSGRIFVKGKKYNFMPTWSVHREEIDRNVSQDKKGREIVEVKFIEESHLQIDVSTENGIVEFSESEPDKIKSLVNVFGLPDVDSVADALPHRVENWANVVAKEFPDLFDYQAEDLVRLLTKRNIYIGFEQGGGKCEHKDTLVNVNGELKAIENIWDDYSNNNDVKFDGEGYWSKPIKPLFVNTYNEESGKIEIRKINNLYKQKVNEKLVQIELSNGTSIATTKVHKYFVNEGVWKNNLSVGDYVAVPKTSLPTINKECVISENLARLYGWQLSEGHESSQITTLTITQSNRIKEIAQNAKIVKSEYGFDDMNVRIKQYGDRASYVIFNSQKYKEFYKSVGGVWGKRSKGKIIPVGIMEAPLDIVKVFLNSLFDGDGGTSKEKNYVEYSSASKMLIDQLQILLNRFGILSSTTKKFKCATNGTCIKRDYYELKMSGEEAKKFIEKIGFGYEYKNRIDLNLKSNSNIYGYYVRDLFNEILDSGGGHDARYFEFSNLFDDRHKGKWGDSYSTNEKTLRNVISRLEYIIFGEYEKDLRMLEKDKASRHIQKRKRFEAMDLIKLKSIYHKLKDRLESDLVFVKVKKVSEIQYDDWVYDLEVEYNHNFIANNTLVHNTVVAMAYAKARRLSKVLIICQGSLVDNWLNEAKKFGFNASALRSHTAIDYLKLRIKNGGFERHETEFFVIGQEFLGLDGGKVFSPWNCIRYDKDGLVTHDETVTRGKCSKNHKYETQFKECPECYASYSEGWSGRYCSSCGYSAYSYGVNKGEVGMRQYPAYKRIKKIFSMIITDESQSFANRSLRGEASRAIKSKNKALLSGTIMRNYVSDVFLNFGWLVGYSNPVFYFSRGDVKRFMDEFGSYEYITRDYLDEIVDASSRKRKGGRKKLLPSVSNLNRFWRLTSPFTVRRRSDDAEELKKIKRKREILWLDMDEDHREIYGAYQEWAKGVIDKELRKSTTEVNMGIISRALWKMRFAATHPSSSMLLDDNIGGDFPNMNLNTISWNKTIKLIEIIKEKREKGEKVIVFTGIKLLQKLLWGRLNSLGIRTKLIDASVNTKNRFAEIQDFSDNGYDALVTGSNILNRGYTIIAANNVIFLDLQYTPEITDQGEYRVIRPGQIRSVNIYYLLSKETIDEDMNEVNRLKRNAISHAIDKKARFSDTAKLLEEADARNAQIAVAKKVLKRRLEPVDKINAETNIKDKVPKDSNVEVSVVEFGEQLTLFG